MKQVNIYIKSSIASSRKRDGYVAYVLELITNRKPVTLSGFEKVTQVTTNQSQLIGINTALGRMTEKCELTIYTDSKYIASAFDNNWIDKWKKKNWTNSKNEPIANKDEWQKLLNLLVLQPFSIRVGEKHEYGAWMERELDRLTAENH